MKRWASLVTAVVLTAVGCGSSIHSSGGADLVLAAGATDVTTGLAPGIAAMWNERHPDGPRVRVEQLPQTADDQRQLLAIELDAGLSQMDILGLDVIWTGEFAGNGWLADLEDIRGDVARVSLAGPLQSGMVNGRLYAAPLTTLAGILYYRIDLIDRPPRTWGELVEIGTRAAQKAGIAAYVGQGAQYEGLVVNYLEHLWGAGGELLGPGATRVAYETEPALAALRFMAHARESGFYPPGFSEMREKDARRVFRSGDAVFMRDWSSTYRELSGGNPDEPVSKVVGKYGIAPLPTLSGEGTAAALGGLNLAVNRHSKNVRAAKEFVRFASTTPEVQRALARRHSATPTMASVSHELRDDPVMALLAGVLPHARSRPATSEWSAISDELQQQIWPAYNGQRDPAEAVRAIGAFLRRTVEHRP